jgi:phospholipid/cholesterol/gamma-HCH transport system substrate-binding protein
VSRFWHRKDEVPASELNRSSPIRYGIVLLVVLHAQFASALNIRPKSPVRIAGINVGKVSAITREGKTGVVTMEIEQRGLPIHEDATVKIRPRVFLEGNWFVELQPGSPSAHTVSSGYTIPVAQTANPVQLDQVLNALNTDTRTNLQNFLIYYGQALTRKPNALENAEQEPELHGLNGAQGFNLATRRGPASLRGAAIINQAITGTETGDLTKLVASINTVASALNVHEQELGELIVNFNTFFGSLASQSTSLNRLVAELPETLGQIDHGLSAFSASFPPTKAFAKDILPGVNNTNVTVAATLPWIQQTLLSLGPNELGGVAKGLAEATPSLAKLQAEQIPFYKQTELFNKCMTNVIYPAGNTKIQDGAATSGVEDYKEFWYGLVGLAGLGQSFDGNGPRAKFLVGNSGVTLRSRQTQILGNNTKGLRLLGRSPLTPLGTRPAYPAQEPAYQPLVPCYKQAVPNFIGPLAQGPADGAE